MRLYNQATEEGFLQCKAQEKYQKLYFALAYFHSVMLERRKFGTLGLNIPYDFNDTDFQVRSKRKNKSPGVEVQTTEVQAMTSRVPQCEPFC